MRREPSTGTALIVSLLRRRRLRRRWFLRHPERRILRTHFLRHVAHVRIDAESLRLRVDQRLGPELLQESLFVPGACQQESRRTDGRALRSGLTVVVTSRPLREQPWAAIRRLTVSNRYFSAVSTWRSSALPSGGEPS